MAEEASRLHGVSLCYAGVILQWNLRYVEQEVV